MRLESDAHPHNYFNFANMRRRFVWACFAAAAVAARVDDVRPRFCCPPDAARRVLAAAAQVRHVLASPVDV